MVLSKREFIKDIILEQQHNNKIAIEDEKEHITYRELHNTCTKISETIQRESDCKNNRNVGIFLNNSVDYAKAYFSIAYMDRTIIPVEVTLSKEQIVSILDYCEISTIITNKKYYEQLTNSLQDYEYFMEIFCIEENKLYQFEGKSRLLSESMESGVSVQDTAIMLHTSGTTSNPKRVMLTHNNLITNVKSNIKSLKLNEEDKSLIVLPMYFGYCNSSQFLTHMYLGASVVIAPQPFNPARFLSFIEKYSITNTTCIPSMLFLTIAMKKKYDLTSLCETFEVLKEIYEIEESVYKRNIEMFNEIFQLEEIFYKPVRTLSLGQRMRADIAAAMIHNPKVLFLDEPTIGLDVVMKDNVRNAIKKINQNLGTTVVLTTHDMSDIELLADKIVMIDHGKMIFEGDTLDLKEIYGDGTLEEIVKNIYCRGNQ